MDRPTLLMGTKTLDNNGPNPFFCLLSILWERELLSLLFLTFSVLVANPKKLLYTVANPARGLLNREKEKKKKKVWQRPPPKKIK